MTAVVAPVELPTARRSYINTEPVQDIHDPNWIPVLSSLDYKRPTTVTTGVEKEVSPYNTASFSPFPTRPPSPKRRAGPSHNYTKSSLAPESVITADVDTNPLPPRTSSIANQNNSVVKSPSIKAASPLLRQKSITASSSDGQETGGSEAAGEASSDPSTIGTASLLGDANLVSTDMTPSKPEHSLTHTARSSIASTRSKASVAPPTSKYNRKPLPSNASTFIASPPLPTSSPLSDPNVSMLTLNSSAYFTSPLSQPFASPKLPPEPAPQPESMLKLGPMKSTASERRQRALHSHPSNISLASRSRRNSSSSETEIRPKPPSVRHKPRKSTESRREPTTGNTTPRSTIYDFQNPNPAPTTPLPDLPPEARRPPTREGPFVKQTPNFTSMVPPPPEAHLASPKTVSNANDHVEMASFMTSSRTVVFRRFDDVHVRLLLCLQDEIAQLEKELLSLEEDTTSASEKLTQRTRVMRDLRKVVAEYDHLFANWSQMQARKASQETMRDLKEWIERPTTSGGITLGKGAQEDLAWLEKSKDLSSVNLEGHPGPARPEIRKVSTNGSARPVGSGIVSLFACASKRK